MTVPATLDLNAATERTWDVIVVGAGPAGALAARETARRGGDVLLIDKATFPRFKVCGCCLNLRALAMLKSVGLDNLVQRTRAAHLNRFHVAASGRQAIAPLPGGAALARETLDAALVEEAIAAGVSFLPATVARLGPPDAGARDVLLQQGKRERRTAGRVILAADGLGGRFLADDASCNMEVAENSRIGAGVIFADDTAFYGPGSIFMACAAGGYVGLVRVEDGRLVVATALDPAYVKRAGGLGPAVVGILAEAGFPPIAKLEAQPWRGTPLLTRRTIRPVGERVFALGDAAGYVEPFTGEGMSWALASAVLVAPLAERAWQHWDFTLATRWSMLYHHHITRRQRICRIVADVLRRPRLLSWLVAAMDRIPALAVPLIRYLNFVPQQGRGV